MRVVLVTGLSGAGKSSALRALEDLGFEAIDNLPARLLDNLLADAEEGGGRLIAIGMDARTRGFAADAVLAWVENVRRSGQSVVTTLYMDCAADVLARRFTETRRRHPLALDRPVADGIAHERSLLTPLRERADVVIDTTDLSLTDLRRGLGERFAEDREGGTVITVLSFAYKHGLPREADVVIDVRFLRNPFWDMDLRPLTGQDGPVARHIEDDPAFAGFFDRLTDLFALLLPGYLKEGKSYLTIAFGCTGGRHRSVFVAERLATHLRASGYRSTIRHRDLAV